MVIERLAPIPSKPQSVVVERWLPYNDSIKRRVIFRAAPPDPVLIKPRNVIVQWEAPNVNIRQEIKYLGVVRANPAEYVEKYGDSLKSSNDLPVIVNQIQTPEGITLAADHVAKKVYELEGDIEGLSYVDLEREGLSEYRNQLQELGVKYLGSTSALSTRSSKLGKNTTEPKETKSAVHISSLEAVLNRASSSSATMASASAATASAGDFLISTAVSSTSVITTSAVSSSPFVQSSQTSTANASSAVSAEALAIIDNVFTQIDTNNDGNIEVREAERIFLRLNSRLNRSYGEDEVKFFFQKLDTNMDGFIDLHEFRTAMLALI